MKTDKITRTAPARSNESLGQRLLTGFVAVAIVALLVLACSARQVQKQSNAAPASLPESSARTDPDRTSPLTKDLPLRILSEVPLTGGATLGYPLLVLDMYEHAYQMHYGAPRPNTWMLSCRT
jgi:superoxide dismutase